MIFEVCSYYLSIVGIVLGRHQISNNSYTVDFHSHMTHFRRLIYNSNIVCHNLTRMNRSTLDMLGLEEGVSELRFKLLCREMLTFNASTVPQT